MKQQTNEPQPQPQDNDQTDYYEKGQQSVWGLIADVLFGGKGK